MAQPFLQKFYLRSPHIFLSGPSNFQSRYLSGSSCRNFYRHSIFFQQTTKLEKPSPTKPKTSDQLNKPNQSETRPSDPSEILSKLSPSSTQPGCTTAFSDQPSTGSSVPQPNEPSVSKPNKLKAIQPKSSAKAELPRILPPHPFNTHEFVRQLETSAFGLEVSRTIMKVVKKSLETSEHRWLLSGPSGGVVSRAYAEGQAYLYNAALGELRTEVKVKTRNDGIVLKSASNVLQREIDSLKQKMKEDVDGLKNEIQLEMNGRKEEASDDQKKLELAIQELNSKFTILVGDVRTEIETRKWITTRRCIVAIASLALCVIIFTALESNQINPVSSSATNAQKQLQREVLKTVEDLGITPARDESDSGYSSGVFGQGKRIGDEDNHDGNTSF
ncbi:uncharacterized protein MELLADRAFT_95455 [Melampsora larici-populina 98AG31]|uniref:Uncharacterized protein n=1 Tax=Melampsora larici-populina (strain 98AG31 / pathotype 3-4-7) TaxID=747676 RepID=F4S9D9_MELLP|nr:uncharacterized protein MELLADRAFT_95455 [Melampsora larici-populina 98AG31]EGF98704.1 hypothetical protein MELLADRAFT_95455 [Melampsora larici-populina 98AG31]